MPRRKSVVPQGIKPSAIVPAIDRIEAICADAELAARIARSQATDLLDQAENHIHQLTFALNRARRRIG